MNDALLARAVGEKPVEPPPPVPGTSWTHWPESEFWKVPLLEREGVFEMVPAGAGCVVVLPGGIGEMHDSGFRCFSLVFFGREGALGRSPCISDHLIVYLNAEADGYERLEFDVLPISGLLRFWSDQRETLAGRPILSSVDVHLEAPSDTLEHHDNLMTVRHRMAQWVKAYGADELRVAMDEALEAP